MSRAFHQKQVGWILLIGALFAVPFLLWPQVDIWISSQFYLPGQGFYMEFRPHWRLIYHLVNDFTRAVYVCLIALLLTKLTGRLIRRPLLDKIRTASLLYLALVMVAGPWLGVHYLLKEGFERPRPREIVEFGGDKQFVPILHVGHEGGNSFVSGHASMGYFLVAFALLAEKKRRRAMYLAGLGAGTFIGLVRVIQGGHFASDVVFAGIFMLMVIHASYALFCKQINEPAHASLS